MKFRCVQTFSLEYLQKCRAMAPDEILQFLNDFSQLYAASLNPISKKLKNNLSDIDKLQFNATQKSDFLNE